MTIAGQVAGSIGAGFLVLVGIEDADTTEDSSWLATKIAKMRLFPDAEGKMNAGLAEAQGRLLVVSQFTLHASTKKGNRPSFMRAARPEHAVPLYEHFLEQLEAQTGTAVERGVFGADMKVALINDGPVTVWIDTQAKE